jgi:hypothetical protein
MNNLYLVKVAEDLGYDSYDGAVISAKNEEEAISCFMELENLAKEDNLTIELIGTSICPKDGVIFYSFNEG